MRQKPLEWSTVLIALWVSAITTKVLLALAGKRFVNNTDEGFVWLAVFSCFVGVETLLAYKLKDTPEEKGTIHVVTSSLNPSVQAVTEKTVETTEETEREKKI